MPAHASRPPVLRLYSSLPPRLPRHVRRAPFLMRAQFDGQLLLYYPLMQIQTYTLFNAFGIPVRANLSVALLALYLLWVFGWSAGLYVVSVLLISIVLHELAHSVVAVAFGGKVRDITLQLLGGCAAITRMPAKPWQECLMAAAGPACSFVLAALAFGAALLASSSQTVSDPYGAPLYISVVPNEWLMLAAMLNVGLGIFNLLPAFPMDGGRILRSLLQTVGRLTKVRATEIAVGVGKAFALLWGVVSLLSLFFDTQIPMPANLPDPLAFLWDLIFGSGGVLLLCIAVMIWTAGRRELEFVRAEAYYGGQR